MTFQEFQVQLNRLAQQFGKNAYGDERAKLIWREVNTMSAAWWERFVDKAIGYSMTPPLLPQIQESLSLERERTRERERAQEKQDAEDFWSGRLMPEEKKQIVHMIKRRIMGQVSDADYEAFMRVLPK
jgi:hypothetical protein